MIRIQEQPKAFILVAAFTISAALSSPARAGFILGEAANYGLIAGPITKSMQFSNSTLEGNIATDNSGTTAGGNYVQFSSGVINGNFSFVGTAQTNLGSGTLHGTKIAQDSNVSSAYDTISTLSTTFAGEVGKSFGGSGSINATSGTLDGTGNHVFTTTAEDFLKNGALTITGSASDYVVIDVTGNQNVQLKHLLSLSGGISDDHVFINITGTGHDISGNTYGGIVNGVIVGLNDGFNIGNTTIDGRMFGGSNQDFQLNCGFVLDDPPPPTVPEPASIILVVSAIPFGIAIYARGRRRSIA